MIFRLYFFLFWFHIFTKCCQNTWTDQDHGTSQLNHEGNAPYMPAFGDLNFGKTDAYGTMQAQQVTGNYTASGSVLNARDYSYNNEQLLTPVRSDAMNTSQAYMINNTSTYVHPESLVPMRGYYENYSPFNNRRLYAPYHEPLLMAQSQVANIQEQERQWVYGPYEDTNTINTDKFGFDVRKRPHCTIQNALTSQKRASAYTALDSNATRHTKRLKLLQPSNTTRPEICKPREAHNEGFTPAAQEFKTIMTKQQNNYITQELQAAENASRFPYPSLAAHYDTIGLESEPLDLTSSHRKSTIKPKKKWETKFTESDKCKHEIQLANNITEIGKLTSTSTTHNSNTQPLYGYTGTVQDVNPVSCAANINEKHLSMTKMQEQSKMPRFSLYFLGNNKLIADALYERTVFSRKHGASRLDSDESNRFLDVLQRIHKFAFNTTTEKFTVYFKSLQNKPNSKIKLTKYKDDSKLKIFTKAKEHLRTKKKSIYLCKKIHKIYKLYHAKISALTEFEDKRKVFAEFVRKVMFCEREKNGGITVKPEVWSVQLFMFEIIIYILWRLEMTEMPIYDNGFEYSFEKEMQHILYLLYFFHKYGHISKVFDESQTYNGVVYEYRTFILQSLMSRQHYKSAPYYFYKHAYNVQRSCTHKSSLIKKKNILLMIAFTSHKTSLNIFARNIACDEMANKNEFYLQQFFHRRLCQNATYKSELVAILFSTVEFLNLLKHGQSRTNDESMLFAPFKKVTLFVSPIFSKGKLKIQTMSSNEMMNYFFNVIYTLQM